MFSNTFQQTALAALFFALPLALAQGPAPPAAGPPDAGKPEEGKQDPTKPPPGAPSGAVAQQGDETQKDWAQWYSNDYDCGQYSLLVIVFWLWLMFSDQLFTGLQWCSDGEKVRACSDLLEAISDRSVKHSRTPGGLVFWRHAMPSTWLKTSFKENTSKRYVKPTHCLAF